MPIDIECAQCGKKLRVKDTLAGKRAKCPGCGNILEIPAPDAEYELAEPEEHPAPYEPATGPAARPAQIPSPFTEDVFLARRKVFTFLGAKFHLYDMEGNLVGFSKQKAFKLKEDIRLYRDESMSQEILHIRARQILDISAAYDVIDSASGKKIGALQRKGLTSAFLRDEWQILDANDRPFALVQEESTALALLRRYVGLVSLISPQKYIVSVGGRQVGSIQQHFNPFVLKYTVDFSMDTGFLLPRSLGVASAILLLAIEKRQQ